MLQLTTPDTREKPFSCSSCQKSFSRRDVQEKHSKRCADESESQPAQSRRRKHATGSTRWTRSARACDRCKERKLKCDDENPCTPCRQKQLNCVKERPAEPVPENVERSSSLPVNDINPFTISQTTNVSDLGDFSSGWAPESHLSQQPFSELADARANFASLLPVPPMLSFDEAPAIGPLRDANYTTASSLPLNAQQATTEAVVNHTWGSSAGVTDLAALFPELPSLVSLHLL